MPVTLMMLLMLLQPSTAAGMDCQTAGSQDAKKAAQPVTEDRSEPPHLVKQVRPKYPEAARQKGITGVVLLEILINKEGRVTHARVLRSVPGLDEAAIECIHKWRFTPALKNGEPVSTIAHAPVSFRGL